MIVIYGGVRETVLRQLDCEHDWHGPCLDAVSRYNKCLKCFCVERDLKDEASYWAAMHESSVRAKS